MSMTLDEAIMHCRETAFMKDGACGEQHRQLDEWLEELKQYTEKTRWIPCSERLPEENGDYLVNYHDDNANEDYSYLAYFHKDSWFNLPWFPDDSEEGIHHITAWMPLPEPYHKEEK